MPITSISIDCRTIARNESGSLSIDASPACDEVYLHFGNKDRDVFIVQKDDLLSALHILGIM